MKADQWTPEGKLINGQTNGQEHKPISSDDDGFEPAIRINRQRITKGKPEYLVLFKDGSQYWCDAVTQGLVDNFRVQQEKLRDKRRKGNKRQR